MSKALPFALVAITAGAAGYVLGGSGQKSELRAAPKTASCEPATLAAALSTVRVATDNSALRDDVRRIIREELAAAGHAPQKDRGEREREAERPAPTAESVAARETSQQLIATSLSTHRWTREQKSKLRDLLPQMTDEQRAATLAELIPAMNRQEIIPEEPGAPF
ncbi:MAG TPA: hypothetical protein VFF06_15935 [Polyangia bacterium]|nr:hypothetical protein [Polyangia bacterium]